MPKATSRAHARTMPAVQRSRPSRKDFIGDLSFLPDRYAMPCVGNCLEPEIPANSVLIFDRTEPYKPGDLVILFRRCDLTPTGEFQGIVKRLVMAPPSYVTFPWREHPKSEVHALVVVEMLNPRRRFAIPCADLLGIHRCLGVAPPELKRVKMAIPAAARKEG